MMTDFIQAKRKNGVTVLFFLFVVLWLFVNKSYAVTIAPYEIADGRALFSDQARSSRYPSASEVKAVLSGKKVNGIYAKSYRNEVSTKPLIARHSSFDWRKLRIKSDGNLVYQGKVMAWMFSALFILAGLVIGGIVLSNRWKALRLLIPVFMMSISGSMMAYYYQATISFDVEGKLVTSGGGARCG